MSHKSHTPAAKPLVAHRDLLSWAETMDLAAARQRAEADFVAAIMRLPAGAGRRVERVSAPQFAYNPMGCAGRNASR